MINLGKGPKIKKSESMVFDYTPLTPSPPLTLTMVFLLRIFKICTENGQIRTTKTPQELEKSARRAAIFLVSSNFRVGHEKFNGVNLLVQYGWAFRLLKNLIWPFQIQVVGMADET